MLTDMKMKKKIITELGHSDRLTIYVNPTKIYVDPDHCVHSNDLFSETIAPMVLKFHMQHDKRFFIKFVQMKVAGSEMALCPGSWV